MAGADRTYIAVQRQLKAMAADKYEVGILDQDEKMMLRTWSAQQILDSLRFLKFQNMQRCHIYVRPKGNQGLVMMDDATQAVVKRLHNDGLNPACVIESSPLNFQVWLRLRGESIDNELCSDIAKYLAEKYGTDKAAADWRRFGRLAGFTNTKPQHVGKDGHFPFSLVSECTGALANEAGSVFEAVHEWRKQRENDRRLVMDENPPDSDALAFFRRELVGLVAKYGADLDESRADWMITSRMAQRGFAREDIAAAMLHASPDLHERRRGRVEQYINHTLDEVYKRFGNPASDITH